MNTIAEIIAEIILIILGAAAAGFIWLKVIPFYWSLF